MSRFLGDISRLVVHEPQRATALCAVEAIERKNRVDIYSTELLEHLVRTERWHSCEHCLVAGTAHGAEAAPAHAH